MSLLQTIKKDQVQSRKDRNAQRSSLLTTLLGEAAIIGKNDGDRESTDAEVVAVVKKFVKNLEEVKKVSNPGEVPYIEAEAEIEILNEYLPQQLTEEQLRDYINDYVQYEELSGMQNMGKVMGYLKGRYDGQYDGKTASRLVKEILS